MKIERADKPQAPKLALKDLVAGTAFILKNHPDLGPFLAIRSYDSALKECTGGGRWHLQLGSGVIEWSNELEEVVVLDAKVVIS